MSVVADHLAPSDEQELSAILREKSAMQQPVRVIGGGTRVETGHLTGAPLGISGISGVVTYLPGEMTLIARAGTPLEEIEAMVEAEGQSLAFEPPDMRGLLGGIGAPTIGGAIAANACGPRRLRAGAARDHLLGVRFIDGQGRILRNGGRVMKNVTGLDLSRLLCGSNGTLGILTEVALKTLPQAQAQATLVFHGLGEAQATRIFSAALATPFEVSGAAFLDGTAWLRIEGLTPQVEYRTKRLSEMFDRYLPDLMDADQTLSLWRNIRDVRHFTGGAPLWRILVKPTDAGAVCTALHSLGGRTSLDWGGGLIWYCGAGEANAIRQIAAHSTLVRRGETEAAAFPPESPAIARLSHDLRRRFDPAAILNPGLMDA